MPSLFDKIELGPISPKNRIFMAPLTRKRATREHIPTPRMATYYAQRASAGLIISEAIGISKEGMGFPSTPGLWNDAQVEAWKPVVDQVHQAGGLLVAQLWHQGRKAHSAIHGIQPVSASATTAPGYAHGYDNARLDNVEARPLRIDEMPRVVDDFVKAARNAMRAGFDGIQLHAANGYLIDQFLRDSTNFRDDEYGGSFENRMRLLREVTTGVISEIGASRTAIRLSPNGDTAGCDDSRQELLFPEVAKMLSGLKIAFLELRELGPEGTMGQSDRPPVAPLIRKVFQGPLILNWDPMPEDFGAGMVSSGEADAISIGRAFIPNPDLVRRIHEKLPLSEGSRSAWYAEGDTGYTDYAPYQA